MTIARASGQKSIIREIKTQRIKIPLNDQSVPKIINAIIPMSMAPTIVQSAVPSIGIALIVAMRIANAIDHSITVFVYCAISYIFAFMVGHNYTSDWEKSKALNKAIKGSEDPGRILNYTTVK